jgi:hypothetical protein
MTEPEMWLVRCRDTCCFCKHAKSRGLSTQPCDSCLELMTRNIQMEAVDEAAERFALKKTETL